MKRRRKRKVTHQLEASTSLGRAAALVDRLERAAETVPLTVKTTQGPVAHPVLRQLDLARKRLDELRRQERLERGVPEADTQRRMRIVAADDARAAMRAFLEEDYRVNDPLGLLARPETAEQWAALVEHCLALARRGQLSDYRGPR